MVLAYIRKQLAERLLLEEDAIGADSRFDELGADSVDLVELVMALEARFEVQLEDDQLERVHTVGDLIALVEEFD